MVQIVLEGEYKPDCFTAALIFMFIVYFLLLYYSHVNNFYINVLLIIKLISDW